jgi:hypothetical protein
MAAARADISANVNPPLLKNNLEPGGAFRVARTRMLRTPDQ